MADCECLERGVDYYGVLGIKRNADDLEIQKAFRRLAIRYNPKRLDKSETSEAFFSLVAEAYDVLSHPLRRTVYDQYGENGLKIGLPGHQDWAQPYVYHGEPMRTYREFFGTESPYADLLDVLWKPPDIDGRPEERCIKCKEEPFFHPLPLTLSEVFYGGCKKMKIERLVFKTEEKIDTVICEKILNVPIRRGIPTGTRIIFPEMGDEGPSKVPADVIFITEDRAHDTFKRECANLVMTFRIFLREALAGTVVTVNTIDDRILHVPITSIVRPDYEKIVAGEGLPYPDDPHQRGDLVIRFDVEFPVYLPMANKNYVKKVFDDHGARKEAVKKSRHLIAADKVRRNVDDDVPLTRDRGELERRKLLCRD